MISLFYNSNVRLIGLVALIGLAFFSLLKSCFFYEAEGEIEARSKSQYSCISTEYLGKYLSDTYPNAKALIFYDSISSSNLMKQRIDGLKKGLGSMTIVKEIGLPSNIPEDIPRHMIRSCDYIKANDFNKAIKKYTRANLIISLIGLPEDYDQINIWGMDDKHRPKVALFGASLEEFKSDLENGFVNALVIYKQMDKSVNQLPPSNLKEAFNKRFKLITDDNVNELDEDSKK